VRRRADVDAAVVVLLALDLAEAPFDVEDAVAELVIVKQHFLDADAIAQQQVPLNLPGVPGVQRRIRGDGNALPHLEFLAGVEIEPTCRVALEGALLSLLPSRPAGAGQDEPKN